MRRIPLLTPWLQRRARAGIRQTMRGYRIARTTNRLHAIRGVVDAMTNTSWARCRARASARIFGAGLEQADAIVRQYLLIRVVGTTFNSALLRSLVPGGPAVAHPMPAEWRAVLREHGFRVAPVRAALAWYGYVFLVWGYGVLTIFRRIAANLRSWRRGGSAAPGRYAYFERLAPGNLPQPGGDGLSHDILSWYAQWDGRAASLDAICHGVPAPSSAAAGGVPVRGMPFAIPPLESSAGVLRYAAWGIAAAVTSALDLVRGRWWHALLLSEAGSAALVRFQDPSRLARDYLFHNSGWIYRPLWTYDAERAGARILFYFYSTNCETFKQPHGYPTQANSWQALTWPRYLVWDTYQEAFVRRVVPGRSPVDIVGPIWFSCTAKELPPLPDASVAVFDVQPWRSSGYRALGLAEEYYTPETVNHFLVDIHDAARRAGAVMLLKRKRQVGRWLHPRYRALLQRLDASKDFISIDPDMSAVRVIERARAVVSLPFTSTALLAREMGKPSVYYDPHGVVQKDDRAAHGIPILTGARELGAWLSAHVAAPAVVERAAR